MKLSVALALACILSLTTAQVPHWGPCPEPAVQPGFNLRQVKKSCLYVEQELY